MINGNVGVMHFPPNDDRGIRIETKEGISNDRSQQPTYIIIMGVNNMNREIEMYAQNVDDFQSKADQYAREIWQEY